jgi:hypothetical protein
MTPSGATAANGPGALWQRCDGGAEDVSCFIPRGIAVNPTSGNVYISDQSNSRIVEMTAWGELVRAWGWGVSDGSEELQVCTSAATCRAGIPGGGRGQLTVPQGIAVDSAGNVYVAEGDEKHRRVQKFDSEGHFLLMFGGKVNKTKVEAAAPEAEQNLCPVAPADVCQAATEGAGNGQFGTLVAGSFIATGPSPANLLYVGDQGRVQVFNPNGSFKENFPDPEGIISSGGSVQSLAPAPGKGLFLVSNGKADVTRLTAEGKKSCTVDEVNPQAKLEKPTALAIAATATGVPTGNLYVFDGASAQGRQFSTACADKEAPFAKGEISSSTGMAVGSACLLGAKNAEVYLSNSVQADSYVRAYGTAPDNTALCPKPTFAPEVVTEFAVSAGTTEAQLRAQINPRFQADTEYFVQYGTAACLEGGFEEACVKTQPMPPAALGAPAIDFPFATAGVFLTGLVPATSYRYRFVAQSSGGGPVFGAESAFTTSALPAGGALCPNEAFRSGASAALPDCRAYEMVSPVDKEGGDVITELDFASRKAQRDQSSDTGERFTYSAFRAFGDAQTSPFTSQYLAERTPSGWSSHDISPPRGVGLATETAGSSLNLYSEFQAFSADLCNAWLTVSTGTAPPLAANAEPFNFNIYRRSNCGAGADSYQVLSKVAHQVGLNFAPLQGLSADEGTVVFKNKAHLSQDVAIPASSPGEANRLACLSPVPQKEVARQWLRDGTPIAGATSREYTVNEAEDAGHTIQCRLTASGGGSGSTQVANPAWVIAPYPAVAPPEAPAHIAPPSSSGPLDLGGAGGQALSCDSGAWEGSPSFAYQWYRNGAPIAGAEATEYAVQSADLTTPSTFQCEAIATNAGGTVVATSDVLATDPAPNAPIARPYMAFNGDAQVLYASTGKGKPHAVCVMPGGTQSNSCSAGTAGGALLTDGRSDQVDGAIAADGSRVFWTDSGLGAGKIYARENPTAPQSALAHGQATGAGKRTSGSATVEEVSTASGAFAVGQTVSGEGIPFGTTILAVGAGTLTLSANATKSTAASAALAATSECTEAEKACTVGVSETVEGAGGSSRFWAASPDGSKVLFSSAAGLEQDLYLLDVETQTPTLIAHRAFGVVGTSKDLSRIYFLSKEALTGGETNSEGAVAQEGQPNLYLRREGGPLSFVATLSSADAKVAETGKRLSPVNVMPYLHGARVSPDGESAAFISTADPTGYDNTDLASGQADAEVYLYRAASGNLICASCVPSGARPLGRDFGSGLQSFWMAAKLPNIENELYAQHVLSEDGQRLFFEGIGPLAGADTNGKQDVYEWEAPGSGTCSAESPSFSTQDEGCVDLISSGESPQDSELLDASPSGNDVFIRTGSSLVPQDPGLFDVYDARAGGGFAPPPGPRPPCEGEACQSPPAPPAAITPASAAFSGAGNPAQKKQKKHKKHHKRKHKRAQRNQGRAGR